jgi:hypothetical protein
VALEVYCGDGAAGVYHLISLQDGSPALPSRHHVRGHYRAGRWVRPHTARNPGRRSNSASPPRRTGPLRIPNPPNPRKLSTPARVAVTIVVSATIVIGGVSIGLRVSSSARPTTSGSSPVGGEGQPSVRVSTGTVQASLKRTTITLSASGYGGYYLPPEFDNNCASHSYGQVQNFFRSHPCRWLARAYIVVRDHNQGLALVAISWVDMPTFSLSMEYKHMVDTPGTGNITELSRESGSYRNVAFTGNGYLSGIIGTAVWNVQVQPISSASAEVLKKILNDSRQ